MSDEPTTGGEEDLPQTDAPEGEDLKCETCVEEAWRLLANGVYSFRAIAKGVNARTGCIHDGKWVKRVLVRHGGMIEETIESGAIPSRAKYLQALYERRAALAGIAARGPSKNKDGNLVDLGAKDGDRIAAYKAMIDCDEKIAAAEGVVTERKGMDLKGTVIVEVPVVTPNLPAQTGATDGAADTDSA